MRIIRWWGLGVFAGLVLVVAGGWWLLADVWLERAVEGAGTRMVGAKVELRDADLGLFPIRVELNGLRVTNPRRPMRNALAAERIAFGLDTRSLVFGRTRIEEIAVEGTALDTKRSVSGALPKRKRRDEPGAFRRLAGKLELPGLAVPEVATVLAKADVRSLDEAKELAEEAGGARKRFARRAEELPGDSRLKDYRQRAERLRTESRGTAGSLLEGGRQAKALKRDIGEDIDRIRDLKRDLTETRKALAQRQQRLERMPGEDAARLAHEYGPSAEGLANVAEAFLGPRVAGWMRSGWYWYGVARPYLGSARQRLAERQAVTASKPLRSPGLTIHFPSGAAQPRTVIRRVAFSRRQDPASGIGVTGEITNITPQPTLWPEPLQARLSDGTGGTGYTLEAVLDHRTPGSNQDRVDLVIKGTSVAGWRLGEGTGLPLRLDKGTANTSVEARFQDGEVDARIRATVTDAVFDVATAGKGELGRAVSEALKGVDRFTLQGRVRGTPEKPSLKLESSLEKPLRMAVGRLARQRREDLESGLRQAVAKRLEAPLERAEERLANVRALEKRVAQRLTAFRKLQSRI